ncbi:MAG: penicillin-insensitive murein endopeptidase [Cardiobacteriaceae bacterium]|nr:penicillin-insensitive murein endopeptidase [Cardiobacteriaceae bacterium]
MHRLSKIFIIFCIIFNSSCAEKYKDTAKSIEINQQNNQTSRQFGKYTEEPTIWSEVKIPAKGHPQSIGGYSNGCQIGAIELPKIGIGYYDIRRYRHRFFSQPSTISVIQNIGQELDKKYAEQILLGDLSQPIGGLMSYAHISHQNGLDADIYFATIKRGTAPNDDYEAPAVVDKATGKMKLELWKPQYRDALFTAANNSEVTRIFVNPIIKKHLCDTEKNTSWLKKIRPWGGHTAHFHLRVRCPINNPLCNNQAAVPNGDGCNQDLVNWIERQRIDTLNPKPQIENDTPVRPTPPAACLNLLNNK